MDQLISLVGLCIVAIAMSDIFLTVLNTQRESRISASFDRAVWVVLRGAAAVAPRHYRHSILSWGLPLMIGGLIGFWVLLLILGYAVVYAPWVHDASHFGPPVARASSFADALYISGVTLSTIGYGDVTPVSWPFRALSVMEGLSGLIVITLSATYLLTVYPSIGKKNVLAEGLNQETDGRVDAVPFIARHLCTDNFQAMAMRLTKLENELRELSEAHRYHSVLYYSHPIEIERSLVRILLVVRGLVSTISFGLHEEDEPPERRYLNDPRIHALTQSFTTTLHTLATSIHVPEADEIKDDDANRDYLRNEYRLLREELHRLGLISQVEGGLPEEFASYRLHTDNYINSYRRHARYESAEVEQDFKPVLLQ